MLKPCNPCVCIGAPCEQCMFGYMPAKDAHELMKKLIIALNQGEKPVGWKNAETYKRYHPDWEKEMEE